MEMTESEGGLASMELRFLNAAQIEGRGMELAFEGSGNDALSLGRAIRVVAGDTYEPQEIFRGVISGLELVMDAASPPALILLAEDGLQAARMARRTRVFRDLGLDDVLSRVADGLGLRLVSAGFEQQLPLEVQFNETDLGFLRRLAGRFGFDFQIVGEEFQVSPRAAVDRGELELQFADRLISVRILADLADQVSGVTVSGWDPDASHSFEVTGEAQDLGPGRGRTGAAILAEVMAERREHAGAQSIQDRAEAQALAEAAAARRARRFVTVEGLATGDPRLRVGTRVAIGGTGARFDNTYYVTHAQHRYDRQEGYVTEFRAECAFFGG
jgi:phage protein D